MTVTRFEKTVFCKLFPDYKLKFIAIGNNESGDFIGEISLLDNPEIVIAVCDKDGLHLVHSVFNQKSKNTILANTLSKHLTPLAVSNNRYKAKILRQQKRNDKIHKQFEEYLNRSK